MLIALSNPYNLGGVNGASFESQHAAYFPSTQLAFLIRMPLIIDLIVEESQKEKVVEEDGLGKLVFLKEMMRAIEGTSLYDLVRAAEMCLVFNVVIPKTFRVQKFVKYIGTQCPITHLKTYCNKIAKVVHDEKLLIHFFQDYLSDTALTWYMWLDNTKVKRWKDLVDAFIRQCKFNMNMTLDRSSLQATGKGTKESIREYTQIWREVVTQVNIFLLKRDGQFIFQYL
jgi:hypothetical protein